MKREDLYLFERAFSSGSNGCRRTCNCGRVFYDIENHWDWEEGELESLQADKEATPVTHACGSVIFNNAEFAMDCTCWHKMAQQMINIIRNDKRRIANFINFEADHIKAMAESSPRVKQ